MGRKGKKNNPREEESSEESEETYQVEKVVGKRYIVFNIFFV